MALIIARPGPLRDSLQAFLLTLSQVGDVRSASDASSALKIISESCPDLVLMDSNLPGDESLTVLSRIRADGPRSRCLFLADDRRQQENAIVAGADVVLLKGCRATELFDAIEKLLG